MPDRVKLSASCLVTEFHMFVKSVLVKGCSFRRKMFKKKQEKDVAG